MILRIARKEALETLRDGRFRWFAATALVLVLTALAIGAQQVAAFERARRTAQAADRETWLSQGEKNQHSAAHYGSYAFKPMGRLATVDRGVLPYAGTSVFLEAHRVKDASFRAAEDAAPGERLGQLTAATTLRILIPLLIILLAFPAFAGEREQGTLRQLLSLGVERCHLALGKALGLSAPLGAVLVPAALIGAAALLVPGPGSATPQRVALLGALYLAYFGIVLALSLAVSALAPSARTALVVLLGFWFANSFLAPRLAIDGATARHPSLSAAQLAAAVERGLEALPSWEERTGAVEARLMAEHGVSRTEDLPASVAGTTLFEAERDETEVHRRALADLDRCWQAQQRSFQWASLAFPALAVEAASMAVAGSDYSHHRHFVVAAEDYRYSFVQALNQDMVVKNARWDFRAGRELWESVPPFTYQAPGLGWALGHVTISLATLGLWLVATPIAAGAAAAHLRPL